MRELEKHNIVQLEGNALVQAVKNDFGLAIENPEKVIRGMSSQVYGANIGDKKVFIRINEDLGKYRAENEGYKIFKEMGIPVPDVVAFLENPATLGKPTMIVEAAKGIEVNKAELTPEEKKAIFEEAGVLLRKVHQKKLDGFGWAELRDNILKGKYQTNKEYWESQEKKFSPSLQLMIEKGFLDNDEAEKIKNIFEEIKNMEFGQASLLHLDLHAQHIFVEHGHISGIIDLDKLSAGDPRYDIATSIVFMEEDIQEAFKKGYGDLAYDPVVFKYSILIACRKILLRTQRGQKQEHIDKLVTHIHTALKQI